MKLQYKIKNNILYFFVEYKQKRYVGIGSNNEMWELIEKIKKEGG